MRNLKKITAIALFFFFLTNVSAQEKVFKKSLKVNGRIQYDYEFLKRDKAEDWFNGSEFRRVHLSAAGKISPSIKYKVETSFAHAKIGFRDVYIKYLNKNIGNFAVGSMAEPTGLDMATSSKYIPFFERAMLTSMQNFRWGTGLHYENFGLLDGKLGVQMAYTNNGSNSAGFLDKNLENPQNFSARLSSAPIFNKDNHTLLHIGVNYATRANKDLKFRAENHMGGKYEYTFPDAKKRNTLGVEFAGNYKSISLQGEYKTMTLTNDINKDYKMNSYYVMGSYFVTGEHRPYKNGAFGRVKPKKDIDNDGFGALELLVRMSNMTASSDVVDANMGVAKQVNNVSVGLNWYLTAHARLMYNYIMTDDKNDTLGNLKGHLLRFQIDF